MTETEHENEPAEPTVTDVPEPDQDPLEPTPDDDEEGEAEAAETPAEPEASGLTQEQWEAIFTKSDKAFDTYVKRIQAIWEEEGQNLMPVVVSPSAPPGFLHKADAGRVPDDVKTPILEFFGIVREQDYEPDPETQTCAACKGKGKTKTGSTVASHEARPCPRCKGWGYTTQTGEAPTTTTTANGHSETVPLDLAPLVQDDRDNWGEPKILPDGRLNPNYGKQPQFKEQVPPWGTTAGLGANEGVTA